MNVSRHWVQSRSVMAQSVATILFSAAFQSNPQMLRLLLPNSVPTAFGRHDRGLGRLYLGTKDGGEGAGRRPMV